MNRNENSTVNAAVNDRDNSRQTILSAATRLFAQRGYNAVSLRAICAEADISLPMVAYYFENKAGLYKAVLEALTQDFNNELKKINLDNIAPSFRLRKYLEAAVAVHLKNPYFSGVFGHEAYPSPVLLEVMKSKDNYYFGDYIAGLIEEAQNCGALRRDIDSLYAARIIAALFNSHPTISNLYKSFYEQQPAQEKILQTVVEFCLGALERQNV